MPSRLIKLVLLFAAIAMVACAFVAIYSALSPSSGETGILANGTPFPTAIAFGDIPLGWYLQLHSQELNAPGGDDPTPILFTITPGEVPAQVGARLAAQGLIKDADLFVNMVKYLHVGNNIQAGDFVLRRTMTMDEVIDLLQHGYARSVTVTIRPGWRAEEVADYLGTLGLVNFNRDQFLTAVRNGRSDFSFLRDRPKGAPPSLEGFLFPETYNVPYDITVDMLLTMILQTFDQRVGGSLRQEAAASNMSLYDEITLASIIEREAVVASERPTIASVYINRLKKKQLLQADPTVQYAMGYQAATKQWWKSPVSLDEYQTVKSPYNTYIYPGLPPGPICSPSLASITAAIEPGQTDYLFFLAKGDGSHVFAKTYEEQQQNMAKYGYK